MNEVPNSVIHYPSLQINKNYSVFLKTVVSVSPKQDQNPKINSIKKSAIKWPRTLKLEHVSHISNIKWSHGAITLSQSTHIISHLAQEHLRETPRDKSSRWNGRGPFWVSTLNNLLKGFPKKLFGLLNQWAEPSLIKNYFDLFTAPSIFLISGDGTDAGLISRNVPDLANRVRHGFLFILPLLPLLFYN